MNFHLKKKANIQRKTKTQTVHHLVKIELNMIYELSDRTNGKKICSSSAKDYTYRKRERNTDGQ